MSVVRLAHVRYEARLASPLVVLGGGLAGLVAILLLDGDALRMGLALELAAIALGVGAVFCLDDPAARTLEAVPVTLARRRAPRVVVTLLHAGGSWGVTLAVAAHAGLAWYEPGEPDATAGGAVAHVGTGLPVGAASLTAAAVLAAGFGLAALAWRHAGPTTAGLAGGTGLALLAVAAHRLPARFAVLGVPFGGQGWADARLRLLFVAAAGVGILVRASRDRPSPR